MKNKKIIITLSTIILVILCGILIYVLKTPKQEYKSVSKSGVLSGIKYEINPDFGGYPLYIRNKGYYIDTLNQPNAPYFYVISMGECPSGGYDIEIVEIKIDDDKNVKVLVKETTPSDYPSGTSFTMAITFPTVGLTLSEAANTIEIKNTKGEIYKEIKEIND